MLIVVTNWKYLTPKPSNWLFTSGGITFGHMCKLTRETKPLWTKDSLWHKMDPGRLLGAKFCYLVGCSTKLKSFALFALWILIATEIISL